MATYDGGLFGRDLHGSAGNATLIRTRYGVQIRDRTVPRNPQTPLQQPNRARHKRATEVWRGLPFDAVARWRAAFPTGGNDAMNAFTTTYKLLLRLDASALPPLAPPAHAFFGDAIHVETLPPEDSIVRFAASAPNAPEVVTELWLQPLAGPHRKAYLDKYRHAAFVAFGPSLEAEISCEPGWTACAYRFVNAETGQSTALAEIGRIFVDGTRSV